MRGWTWVLIGLMMTAWALAPVPSTSWAAPTDQIEKDLSEKRKDLKSIRKELSQTKEKEKEIRGQESSVLQSLAGLDSELYRKRKELIKMELRLTQTKERLQQTEKQISTLNRGVERTREELFARLTALYKMGRVPPETLLLTSESYLDLLRIDKYLRVVIESDAQIAETYQQQLVLKERYQEELARDQSQRQQAIRDVAKKREGVKKTRTEQRNLLKSIQNQKVVYQKVISELEGRVKEFQRLIDTLEKEKGHLAYGKPRSAIPKGMLTPPVQGKVISLFKEKGQNGIEIRAPMGAEIRAVLPGRVLYADWFKGFGNVIIIDHGDALITVSGYSSQLLKKAGETVSQGESIALVGSEGSLKGPCLYFEVRHDGRPQDPIRWIPQLNKKIVSVPESNEKGKKEL
jgi:septal ring factor EnvC (AmiA/AmiB activator)